MTISLDSAQLIEFFQYLQRASEGSLPIKKAVLFSGMQPDGLCVLNDSTFISTEGKLVNPEESQYVWLDRDLIYDFDKIKSIDICPIIEKPLTTDPLKKLITILETISKHNFSPTLMVLAGAMMSFHYSTVVQMNGGCSTIVAMGQSETGKSTAIRAALSIFECH